MIKIVRGRFSVTAGYKGSQQNLDPRFASHLIKDLNKTDSGMFYCPYIPLMRS